MKTTKFRQYEAPEEPDGQPLATASLRTYRIHETEGLKLLMDGSLAELYLVSLWPVLLAVIQAIFITHSLKKTEKKWFCAKLCDT